MAVSDMLADTRFRSAQVCKALKDWQAIISSKGDSAMSYKNATDGA